MPTLKQQTQSIIDWATKFGVTDDSRLDHDFLGAAFGRIRNAKIIEDYKRDGVIDLNWVQPLGIVSFHKVNIAEDRSIDYCECDLSKAILPAILNLTNKVQGQADIGLYNVMSTCGKDEYFFYPFALLKMLPKDATRNKFSYYFRMQNLLYVNKIVSKLRINAILQDPMEGFVFETMPISSGDLVSGTIYEVGSGTIVYNTITYNTDDTFTANSVTTYSGTGLIYLQNQKRAMTMDDEYPVSSDMARDIIIEILTKEFQIEKQQAEEIANDSTDGQKKQ